MRERREKDGVKWRGKNGVRSRDSGDKTGACLGKNRECRKMREKWEKRVHTKTEYGIRGDVNVSGKGMKG